MVSWLKNRAPNLESHGSSPTSVRAFFSFPLFNLNALELVNSTPRRCFTASLGDNVKPSVPGDLARLASGCSRHLLATAMIVINLKG